MYGRWEPGAPATVQVRESQGFHREVHWSLAGMRVQTWLRRRKDTQHNNNIKGTVLFLACVFSQSGILIAPKRCRSYPPGQGSTMDHPHRGTPGYLLQCHQLSSLGLPLWGYSGAPELIASLARDLGLPLKDDHASAPTEVGPAHLPQPAFVAWASLLGAIVESPD